MTVIPSRVLCVCLGNICRSPTAEVILKTIAKRNGLQLAVDSAGTPVVSSARERVIGDMTRRLRKVLRPILIGVKSWFM